MKNLVIFGTGDIAQLAHFYFSTDSEYEVVAFTVDKEHFSSLTFCDLPVVPFEEIAKVYPPSTHHFFAALSYTKLNELRKEKYLAGKALGYSIASFISSSATVFNEGRIGENCFILEDNTIQPFACIGNNVTLWSGNHIGHHSTVNDHCFIASHAVISGGVDIHESCFIGVNTTLRDHITIGEKSVIGAGTLILENVEPYSVYIGEATQKSRVPSTRLRKI